MTSYLDAQNIMRKHFIGLKELASIADEFGLPELSPDSIPEIHFHEDMLREKAESHLLILGMKRFKDGTPMTINAIRARVGMDPAQHEPCMYHQDWYLKERFAEMVTPELRWYLIGRHVFPETRGVMPDMIESTLEEGTGFPSAVVATYTFFVTSMLWKDTFLWKHDYIWCDDKDHQGDRIYVGRYEDKEKINQHGFNIHRHLSIKPLYGAVDVR